MSLFVTSFASYLVTDDYSSWRAEDHNASKFVKALKGERLNGYAYVPVLGVRRYLGNGNLDDTIEWFADIVANFMQQNGIEPPFALVPVPNSGITLESDKKPRTLKLASAIAKKTGNDSKAVDCLRWKRGLGSARKGTGTRDVPTLYANLAVTKKIDKNVPHMLIDDAIASGGHLQACAAKLKHEGANADIAFCGGHTVHEPPESAFAIFHSELADYEP